MAYDEVTPEGAIPQYTTIEIWKPVPSLPGVLASSWGRLLGPPRSAPISNKGGFRYYLPKPIWGVPTRSATDASHSYRGAMMRPHGCSRQINVKVHRAVCEAFHGPAPFGGAVVIHIDEDAHNNRPENLRWGSQRENMNMPKIKAFHGSRTDHLASMRAKLPKKP